MKEQIIERGIFDFSENYLDKIERKESYTIYDIQEPFQAGAKWMKDFSVVLDMHAKRL